MKYWPACVKAKPPAYQASVRFRSTKTANSHLCARTRSAMIDESPAAQLAQVVVRGLSRGKAVEIDGLGIFYPDPLRGLRFEARAPQVFLAYAREDREVVERLYDALSGSGFGPWMDVRRLLPGQNWPRSIETAI